MSKEIKCPNCKNSYGAIGNHWYHNPSHRPRLHPILQEVVCGIVMGDGYIADPSAVPYLEIDSVEKEYLEYLDDIFGCFSKGVSLQKDAKEEGVNGYTTQKVYRFRTSTHPKLGEFKSWYSDGIKEFPNDITITPPILKHWYAGDGNRQREKRIRICTHNEFENKEKINKLFERSGLPKPNYWYGEEGGYMAWNQTESEFLLNFMGKPLPGFEHKFKQK